MWKCGEVVFVCVCDCVCAYETNEPFILQGTLALVLKLSQFNCIEFLFPNPQTQILDHTPLFLSRPTQSVMYVPLQVNIFHESILLIVQYKYSKSCSGDFCSPESDPPHKIMHYWFYYSIWLGFSFPRDHAGLVEMIRTTVVQVSKGHLGETSP